MPIGVDVINAYCCAYETCKRINKGVVLPPIYFGTERERPEYMLKNFGFEEKDWVVGMDFPDALWKSHYYKEEVFATVLSHKINILVEHGYKVIIIVNGHGATNHQNCIERISKHYSNNSNSIVVWGLAFADNLIFEEKVGHADIYETSLLLHLQKKYKLGELVDISELPSPEKPIFYKDFSIVDAPGFSMKPDSEKIVRADPRNSTEEFGKEIFENTIKKFISITNKALSEKKQK